MERASGGSGGARSRVLFSGVLGALFLWSPLARVGDLVRLPLVAMLPALIVTTAVAAFFVHTLLARLVWRPSFEWSARQRWLLLTGALVCGVLLASAVPIPTPLSPWVPMHELEIVATGEKNPQSQDTEVWVRGIYFDNRTRVAVDEYELEGDWEIRGQVPISYRRQPATLRWSGRPPSDARLVLVTHPWSGVVELTWNGEQRQIDLYDPAEKIGTFVLPRQVGSDAAQFAYSAITRCADEALIAIALLAIAVPLMRHQPTRATGAPGRLMWLAYTLPCLIVWGLTLVTCWPGLMSPDSLAQWHQAAEWRLSDRHPALHTMTLWLGTRIANTPAVVAGLQILVLSLVVGVGLAHLRRRGLPAWLAWVTCTVFALSPVNQTMSISIWKDIPFSVCLLIFNLLVLETVVTHGRAWHGWFYWLGLGVVGALAALYRHNGLPVIVGTLLVLAVVYWRFWRGIVPTIACVVLVLFLVRGPVFQSAQVRQVTHVSGGAGWLSLVVHVLAAHVSHETPLEPDERAFLLGYRPPGPWPDSPYYAPSPGADQRHDAGYLREHRYAAAALAWELTKRRPGVTWQRLLDRADFVWRVRQPAHPQSYLYCTPLPGQSTGSVQRLAHRVGVAFASPWPRVHEMYRRFVLYTEGAWREWVWRPAPYFYLLLLGVHIGALRAGQWRYLLVGLPMVLHAGVVGVFAPGQDFRYMYPVYIVALLIGPYLFWSTPASEQAK